MHVAQVRTTRTLRAFTLVEVLVAFTLLLAVAGFVSWTTAAALTAKAQATTDARTATTLSALLDEVSANDVATLTAGTFTVPHPCPHTATGIAGRSCVQVAGRTLQVVYRFADPDAPTPDCLAASSDSSASNGSLVVQGCAMTGTGTHLTLATPTQTRTLAAPYPGYRAVDRQLVVHLSGNLEVLSDQPLLLVTTADPATVLKQAEPVNGVATFTLATTDTAPVCTVTNPCQVTLLPTSGAAPTLTLGGEPTGLSVGNHATVHVDVQVTS